MSSPTDILEAELRARLARKDAITSSSTSLAKSDSVALDVALSLGLAAGAPGRERRNEGIAETLGREGERGELCACLLLYCAAPQ